MIQSDENFLLHYILYENKVINTNLNTDEFDISGIDYIYAICNVTSASGTNPTLNLSLEGEFLAGEFVVLDTFVTILNASKHVIRFNVGGFTRLRPSFVVGGTSPQFTLDLVFLGK